MLKLAAAAAMLAVASAEKKAKPNIVLFLCDDQDFALGGWTPMKQTTERWSKKGATAANWFIHTPVTILCPRSCITAAIALA